jgi:hypothetical protein
MQVWSKDYRFNPATGDFEHHSLIINYVGLDDFSLFPEM